jgi:hypothetical protein
MAIIFIVWERHMGDRAMLPGNLIKQRIVWTSCVYGMCNLCCMITASNFLPTYFQAVRGDSPTMSGVHVLPSILSQLFCVISSGALSMFTKTLSVAPADIKSDKTGILPSLGFRQLRRNDRRQRSRLDLHTKDNCSHLDRFPDRSWCWSWVGHANCKSPASYKTCQRQLTPCSH